MTGKPLLRASAGIGTALYLLTFTARAGTPAFVWFEGERPARINLQTKSEGVGNPHFLSGKAWLKVSIDADKVEQEVPAEGVLVDHTFEIGAAGVHDLWARIGFEFVRSPFDWRLDGGAWNSVTPDELTTDLMALRFWTEVAWLKLGQAPLTAGSHALSFRLPKTKDAKGKPQRILFALDCVCLTAGEFHPYQFFKPGEDHQTDKDREAAKHLFQLADGKADGARVSMKLNGTWEVCRHDEQRPGEVAAPIADFPAAPRWTAIAVPGDKNERDDLVFAHRLSRGRLCPAMEQLASRRGDCQLRHGTSNRGAVVLLALTAATTP